MKTYIIFLGSLIFSGCWLTDLFTPSIPCPQVTFELMNEMAPIEVEGISLSKPVYIVQGPSINIERIEGYDEVGGHNDNSGYSQEQPFVFETCGEDAKKIEQYLEQFEQNQDISPKIISLIIQDVSSIELFRINIYNFIPKSSESGEYYGRRFTFEPNTPPDSELNYIYQPDQPYMGQESFNMATDKAVEFSGIGSGFMNVEDDEENRILMLKYDCIEAGYLESWTQTIVNLGTTEGYKRSGSVLELNIENPTSGFPGYEEIERMNYYGCFPVKWEMISGYSQHTKLKMSVELSYDFKDIQ